MADETVKITGHLSALSNNIALEADISLRDLFAMAAFGAVIQNHYGHASSYPEEAAKEAYRFADAALGVRQADAAGSGAVVDAALSTREGKR